MTHTVLITGANRGIGLEFVKQYAADGWQVIACTRKPDHAPELTALADNASHNIHIRTLDITDTQQIKQLSLDLEHQAIDLLISNAGIYGPKPCGLDNTDTEKWLTVLKTNVIGPQQLCAHLKAQLRRGEGKSIALITSKMGSISDNSSGGSYLYRSSKAALNQVAKSLSIDLSPLKIKVLALHPGWVVTDMGGPHALIDTHTSVKEMRQTIAHSTMKMSGSFLNYDGTPIPW